MAAVRHAFLIGCSKCGTTTLSHWLGRHREIALSRPKEPNFFGDDARYGEGVERYAEHFAHGSEAALRLEATTGYSAPRDGEKVRRRIARHFPEARFLYIGRQPYRRIESAFRHWHERAFDRGLDVPFSLETALGSAGRPVVENTFYWRRTEGYRETFGASSILYLTLEGLIAAPRQTLRRVWSFLEVAADDEIGAVDLVLNRGDHRVCDSPALRFVRHQPLAWALFQRLPARPARLLRRALERPASALDLRWTDEMRERVRTALAEDVRRYLGAAGEPADLWGEEFVDGGVPDPSMV